MGDEVDVMIRIAFIEFLFSSEILGCVDQFLCIFRLFPRPVVALRYSTFMTTYQKHSPATDTSFIKDLVRSQVWKGGREGRGREGGREGEKEQEGREGGREGRKREGGREGRGREGGREGGREEKRKGERERGREEEGTDGGIEESGANPSAESPKASCFSLLDKVENTVLVSTPPLLSTKVDIGIVVIGQHPHAFLLFQLWKVITTKQWEDLETRL